MCTLRFGLVLLCGLTACSQGEGNVYRSSTQPRIVGSGQSVTVTNVASEKDALPLAEQYCKARGKAVRFRGIVKQAYYHVASNSALFDCVTPAN
jgi:hypothetical protein